MRAELDKAKKRTRELATENVDQEDQINDLKRQIEDLKKGNTQAASSTLSPEKEAELKKRLKELASENVDMEEQVNELKSQVEQLKKQQTTNGTRTSSREEELNKKVLDLQDSLKGKDTIIANQKQEIEQLQAKESDRATDKNELRSRIKELASENVDLEEQLNGLKQEVEGLKQSSLSVSIKSNTDVSELTMKVRDLSDSNRKKDAQLDEKQQEIDRLTNLQRGKDSDNKSEYQQQIQDLTKENKEKAASISSYKQEIERLKRDAHEAQKGKGDSAERDNSEWRRKFEVAINEKDTAVRAREDKEAELVQLR